MFVKQLYQFNKWLFGCFVLFIMAMIFINYKWGMTATPIQQYGMYSAKMAVNDTLKSYQVYVNQKKIDPTTYGLVDRDMMQIPVADFEKQQAVNEQAFATMKGIFNKIGMGGLMKKENFINTTTAEQFTNWYKKQLEKRSGHQVDDLSIFEQQYIWNSSNVVPVGQPRKVSIIVTQQ